MSRLEFFQMLPEAMMSSDVYLMFICTLDQSCVQESFWSIIHLVDVNLAGFTRNPDKNESKVLMKQIYCVQLTGGSERAERSWGESKED